VINSNLGLISHRLAITADSDMVIIDSL